jgi:hypothetical protein
MQQRSYNYKDNLLQLLSPAKEETLKVNVITKGGNYYQNYSSYDSTLVTYQRELELTDRSDSSIRNAAKNEVSAPAGSIFIIHLPMYQI